MNENQLFDHINIPVSNLQASLAFYETLLAVLGLPVLAREQDAVGFGRSTWEVGLVLESAVDCSLHLAFAASTREQVDRFHRAALSAGGRDNGRPGIRDHYGRDYYAAYVLDRDGHNIEIVCRCAA